MRVMAIILSIWLVILSISLFACTGATEASQQPSPINAPSDYKTGNNHDIRRVLISSTVLRFHVFWPGQLKEFSPFGLFFALKSTLLTVR
jgi:hypothetical protein